MTKNDPWADLVDVSKSAAAPPMPTPAPASPARSNNRAGPFDDLVTTDPAAPTTPAAGGANTGNWATIPKDKDGLPRIDLMRPDNFTPQRNLLGGSMDPSRETAYSRYNNAARSDGMAGGLVAVMAGLDEPEVTRQPNGEIHLKYPNGQSEIFGNDEEYARTMFERTYLDAMPWDQYKRAYAARFGGSPDDTPTGLVVDVVGGYEDPNKDQPTDIPGRDGVGGQADTFVRGASNAFTLGLADYAEAGLDTLTGGKSFAENLRAQHKTNEADMHNRTLAAIGGTVLGSLLLPTRTGTVADEAGLAAGTKVLREGGTMRDARSAAAIAGRKAAGNRMAIEGAGYAGATSALNSDSLDDAWRNGLIGAAEGGIAGKGLGAVGGRVLLPPRTPSAISDVMEAAKRSGIDPLPADVGGPVTRGLTSFSAQTPFGAVPIIKAAEKANAAGAKALTSAADDAGVIASDVEGLGTAATEGAIRYSRGAKAAGGRLYDIAGKKAGNAMIDLKSTRDLADEQIARLKAVPGGGTGLDDLVAFRKTLDRPYSVQGVRDMRTEMFVAPDFRGSPVEGRQRALVNAAARDIEDGLRAQGRGDAADAFRAADDNWRTMLANLRRNVEPIIGPLDKLKGAEGVATALNSAMRNNGARVGAFVSSLPAEQQGIVRATMINQLGRGKDGAFTLSQFATDWDKISPIAKRAVFGKETTAALEDLATVGRGVKAANKYSNFSNTGRAMITDRTIGSLLTGFTSIAGLKTFGAAAGGQYSLGLLLASPRFARWLAKAPKTEAAIPAYIARLTGLARVEPRLANDILDLQQRLRSAFASSPTAAAADEAVDESGDGQWNAGDQYPKDNGLQP